MLGLGTTNAEGEIIFYIDDEIIIVWFFLETAQFRICFQFDLVCGKCETLYALVIILDISSMHSFAEVEQPALIHSLVGDYRQDACNFG